MTTILTLDTPQARAALARCVRLLLAWADEDENDTAPGGNLGGETPDAAQADDVIGIQVDEVAVE